MAGCAELRVAKTEPRRTPVEWRSRRRGGTDLPATGRSSHVPHRAQKKSRPGMNARPVWRVLRGMRRRNQSTSAGGTVPPPPPGWYWEKESGVSDRIPSKTRPMESRNATRANTRATDRSAMTMAYSVSACPRSSCQRVWIGFIERPSLPGGAATRFGAAAIQHGSQNVTIIVPCKIVDHKIMFYKYLA